MSDVTRILSEIEQGDPNAADELLPLVYEELRKLAVSKLAQEKSGQTLQGTALVHEAYVRLVEAEQAQHWNSRGHFFAAAAEAMRRILVDNARRKQALKRGGDRARDELSLTEASSTSVAELLEINDAIEKLEADQPKAAEVVKLRFFVGMTIAETAEAINTSEATVERLWSFARARLHAELQ